ncbi:hypothetical protein B0H15DRAFT_958024 [Mycena belliarum]|uniref:Uncharacterized protein n=1 Tax=Mycena belliarum TaxID=1033014 RepID=A0AAD6XDU0_9AGAR|nr:hypothetical protein B0H15DRAFT_958024 [Mycena belliae]
MTLQDAIDWYTGIPTSQWPKGMRTAEGELPTTPNATPRSTDVRAWVTLSRLLPAREDGGSSIHRARWLEAVTRLLSVHGTYDAYTEIGGYQTASLPMENYPFDATNITMAQVAAWLAQHGIAPGTSAVTALESYARSHRNVAEGSDDLSSKEFLHGFPMNVEDAVQLSDEDHWSRLHHAPLPAGLTSAYPTFPGDVSASPIADAPNEDVNMGA